MLDKYFEGWYNEIQKKFHSGVHSVKVYFEHIKIQPVSRLNLLKRLNTFCFALQNTVNSSTICAAVHRTAEWRLKWIQK